MRPAALSLNLGLRKSKFFQVIRPMLLLLFIRQFAAGAYLTNEREITTISPRSDGSSELNFQNQALKLVPSEQMCVHQQASNQMVNLVDLSNNQIGTIGDSDFDCQVGLALRILILRNNQIETIASEAFESLKVLQVLQLDHNLLTTIPVALKPLKSLRHLNLAHNQIEQIEAENPLEALGQTLISLDLRSNPLATVAPAAFGGLTKLKTLTLSHQSGPFQLAAPLLGLAELRFLHLDRANLSHLPANLCLHSQRLATLVLKSNQLAQVPQLGSACRSLLLLDLSYNRLEGSLGLDKSAPFKHLNQLLDLYLGHNRLEFIGAEAFLGLESLQVLELNNNKLLRFHSGAFLPVRLSIRHLNLAHNPNLQKLEPTGLDQLRSLTAHGNHQLRELPHLAQARHLWLTYAYHCCDYLQPESPKSSHSLLGRLSKWLNDLKSDRPADKPPTSTSHPESPKTTNLSELILWPTNFDGPRTFEGVIDELAARQVEQFRNTYGLQFDMKLHDEILTTTTKQKREVDLLNTRSCQPKPSAFLPCQDLFDSWWLRLGVWCVFLLAFAGNILVIIVLGAVRQSSSSSALTSIMWLAHSKRHIDVPRFLVINLAIADLLMAIYLGLLALVDLSTLGEFKVFAIKWQYSTGCKLAGFLGVLSSELSVFILAIITLERNYAITNAVHLNRRLSLQKAMLIMLLGYAFALAMAILPLNGQVSDYRKYSICLPLDMDAKNWASQLYIGTLITINATSFLLLLACYLRMYCAIRGSQAWNTNDLRIARRMSILVLTDFLCWMPIIVVALASLGGYQLVGHEGIKVLTIFILPLNSIANPFLYAITTKKFKRDLDTLARRVAAATGRLDCGQRSSPGGLDKQARYNHYQHNLLAQNKRARKQQNLQQKSLRPPQDLALANTCTCRHPAHPPGARIQGYAHHQLDKFGAKSPRLERQNDSQHVIKSPSSGSLLLQVPHPQQQAKSMHRPHSAAHIVLSATNSACKSTLNLEDEAAKRAGRRFLTVEPNANLTSKLDHRSASACGPSESAKQARPLKEPARACGSYDMADGRPNGGSRLGLNWILFGPLAKAWSSIQISLANNPTSSSLNDSQTHANEEHNSEEEEEEEEDLQLAATIDDILMLSSPSNTARCVRLSNERRMSRSLDIVNQVVVTQDGGARSISSSTQLVSATLSATDDDDQRLMLVTIEQMAGKGKLRQSTRHLRKAKQRARCTRCRSWSPALLNKLEHCISQIKSRIPGITNSNFGGVPTSSGGARDVASNEVGEFYNSETSSGSSPISFNDHLRQDTVNMGQEEDGQKSDGGDKFNECYESGQGAGIKKMRFTASKRHSLQRHKLQQLGSSSNSDTMSTRTAGTLLTNMSLSFDSNTNIPTATLAGPTTSGAQVKHQPLIERQQEKE